MSQSQNQQHKAIIARAQDIGLSPSELASELLTHDLIEVSLRELRRLPAAWAKTSQQQQGMIIERISDDIADAVRNAIYIIAARGTKAVPLQLKRIQVDKGLTVTGNVEHDTPHLHDLVDHAGKLCLLVLAPNDYDEGLDLIKPDEDQPELPLDGGLVGTVVSVGEVVSKVAPAPAASPAPEDLDALFNEAVEFVRREQKTGVSSIQSFLKVGYNRAARMLEHMEQLGIVSAPDSHGKRELVKEAPAAEQPGEAPAAPEITDELYGNASALVIKEQRISLGYIQKNFSLDEATAKALIAQLETNEVVGPENEMGGRAILIQPA